MKARFVSVVCLVAIGLTGVAMAGPSSALYLTYTLNINGANSIIVAQGNNLTGFPEAYGGGYEIPIAVFGDVRTTAYFPGGFGGQYSLSGTPTGTFYAAPGFYSYDGTTDGSHNYMVDYNNGLVYQTARDFSNPVVLFSLGVLQTDLGIAYDPFNNSLWVSGWTNGSVTNYSMNGTVLSSFNTGHIENGALALDPADHTLWLVNDSTGLSSAYLEQYSTSGALLSTGATVGYTLGGEFDMSAYSPVPEPGTFVMLGSGILGLAGMVRRKMGR